MSRRRRNGTQYQIVYWRDIPAQVKVRAGRERSSHPLSGRFQDAIDRAAMRAGVIDTDGYLEEWHTSDWEPLSEAPGAGVEKILADLEAEFPADRLRELIGKEGFDRATTCRFQVVYWCDIPAQVKVRQGRNRISKPLPDRFQDAIDRAAMEAGKIGTNGYLSGWRTSEWREQDGDVDAVAKHLVAKLDAAYPRERLRTMIKQYGYDHV